MKATQLSVILLSRSVVNYHFADVILFSVIMLTIILFSITLLCRVLFILISVILLSLFS
jgi:hypothetical protein